MATQVICSQTVIWFRSRSITHSVIHKCTCGFTHFLIHKLTHTHTQSHPVVQLTWITCILFVEIFLQSVLFTETFLERKQGERIQIVAFYSHFSYCNLKRPTVRDPVPLFPLIIFVPITVTSFKVSCGCFTKCNKLKSLRSSPPAEKWQESYTTRSPSDWKREWRGQPESSLGWVHLCPEFILTMLSQNICARKMLHFSVEKEDDKRQKKFFTT